MSMLFAAIAFAEVKLPYTFNSGMILQEGKPHPIWGMADPGETITVAFAGQRVEAVADDAGEWEVVLAPLEPNPDPQQMVIAGANTRTLNDIIVGEVWLAICSGAMGRRKVGEPEAGSANGTTSEHSLPAGRTNDFARHDFAISAACYGGRFAECATFAKEFGCGTSKTAWPTPGGPRKSSLAPACSSYFHYPDFLHGVIDSPGDQVVVYNRAGDDATFPIFELGVGLINGCSARCSKKPRTSGRPPAESHG